MTAIIDKGNIHLFGSFQTYTEFPNILDVGSKALYLMRMDKIMLPVPPGFVISSHICHEYLENNQTLPTNYADSVKIFIKKIEEINWSQF